MSDHAEDGLELEPVILQPLPRSVKDFTTEEALREALSRLVPASPTDSTMSSSSTCSSMNFRSISSTAPQHCPFALEPDPTYDIDWRVDIIDREKSYQQTVEREMNRLLVLKSYLELDYEAITARNCAFDRLAGLARRSFQATACFVFLLDIGRSWALSQDGKQFNLVPRKDTFCAHVIVSKDDCFIVPDASKDPRFQNSAYVTAENGVRFYAAAPLKAPEGVNIGTFCIIDIEPRTRFPEEDQEALKDFSKLAMDALVHQRELHHKRIELENAARRLASASHDLLTPLSVVQLSISLLNEDTKFLDRLDETQRDYIKAVSSSSAAMAGVCQSLRHKLSDRLNEGSETGSSTVSSTVHSDSSVVGPARTETRKLVQRLNELAALVMTNKAVLLSISVDESVPECWIGSEVQIMHICLHLIVNSIERMDKGQIRFKIRLEKSSDQRLLLFECTDTRPIGNDDTDHELKAIFEEQVLSSYSVKAQECRQNENQDGRRSPLGVLSSGCIRYCDLYECFPTAFSQEPSLDPFSAQICALGGAFGVETRPDTQETSFWFSVPLMLPDEISFREHEDTLGAKPSVDSIDDNIPKRKALVIDDSVIMRKMLCRALEQLNFVTFQAADGMEGLKLMQEQTYDLVLLDFLMPIMDGLDCVTAYRQWEKDCRPGFTQVICGMSAHASLNDVNRGLALGMTDYRPKPLNLNDLRRLKDSAMKRQRTDTILNCSPDRCNEIFIDTDDLSHKTYADDDSFSSINHPHSNRKVCLVATNGDSEAGELGGPLAENRWQSCVTRSGTEALRLLKTRNWDAVILDAELAEIDGIQCITSFRQWEKDHRVHRQNNMMLMGTDIKPRQPHDQMFMVQLPEGVDAAIDRPTTRNELASILKGIADRGAFSEQDIITL